uniref:Lipocalin/cytosolic fatty-acid binding domain-containing protein n=1 Tax=Cricetulus griseus TaxID=10029 RepID=A0A8C2QKE0_CRIGR
MKALLLSFGLGLVAVLQSQDFPDTKGPQDVTGTWYVIARASDMEIPEGFWPLSVTPMTITALEGDNLQVKFTALDTQGVYLIASAVEDHYTFYWESRNSISSPSSVPDSRDPDINPEALEDFQNIVKYAGLNAENIFIPEQNVSGQMFYYIYELPVKDHYIIYMENLSLEKESQRGFLIGRCPEENLEALEEFKNFTQLKGFFQENIIVPEQRGEKTLCSFPTMCHP